MPILSFVIIQSNVQNLSSELAFIEEFMSKSLKFELQGCLLTHLQVAMAFIKTIETEATAEPSSSSEKEEEPSELDEHNEKATGKLKNARQGKLAGEDGQTKESAPPEQQKDREKEKPAKPLLKFSGISV